VSGGLGWRRIPCAPHAPSFALPQPPDRRTAAPTPNRTDLTLYQPIPITQPTHPSPNPQNMLVMRFANPIFGAWWNRHYISNVQISFKEDFGTQVGGVTDGTGR